MKGKASTKLLGETIWNPRPDWPMVVSRAVSGSAESFFLFLGRPPRSHVARGYNSKDGNWYIVLLCPCAYCTGTAHLHVQYNTRCPTSTHSTLFLFSLPYSRYQYQCGIRIKTRLPYSSSPLMGRFYEFSGSDWDCGLRKAFV